MEPSMWRILLRKPSGPLSCAKDAADRRAERRALASQPSSCCDGYGARRDDRTITCNSDCELPPGSRLCGCDERGVKAHLRANARDLQAGDSLQRRMRDTPQPPALVRLPPILLPSRWARERHGAPTGAHRDARSSRGNALGMGGVALTDSARASRRIAHSLCTLISRSVGPLERSRAGPRTPAMPGRRGVACGVMGRGGCVTSFLYMSPCASTAPVHRLMLGSNASLIDAPSHRARVWAEAGATMGGAIQAASGQDHDCPRAWVQRRGCLLCVPSLSPSSRPDAPSALPPHSAVTRDASAIVHPTHTHHQHALPFCVPLPHKCRGGRCSLKTTSFRYARYARAITAPRPVVTRHHSIGEQEVERNRQDCKRLAERRAERRARTGSWRPKLTNTILSLGIPCNAPSSPWSPTPPLQRSISLAADEV